jgi:hypothetical protein
MEVAAAAAVVLGVGVVVVVGVGVGVEVEVEEEEEVEAEAAAAVEVVIESDFHIGICCGVTGFGYGSGMERVWIGVWIGTRYLGRLSRYGCEGRERGISSLV